MPRTIAGNARQTLAGDGPRHAAHRGGGAGNRTRTYDPRITNALLYQLSYPGSATEPRILHFFTQADHEVDAGHFGPRWRWRQAAELDGRNRNVDEGTGSQIVEVVVRVDVGVEPRA